MTRLSLWRYLIVKIGRWKFLETATWLKGNRYLQGSKESLNIDEEESSKNAGRGEGFRRRERTHGGRKKKGSQRKGPAIAFFLHPSLSLYFCPSKIPTTVGIMEISSWLAFIIFPLLPNYARSQERRKKNNPRFWIRIFIYSLTFFVRSKISWQSYYYTPL